MAERTVLGNPGAGGAPEVLEHIKQVYGDLHRLGDLTITACGPRTPEELDPQPRSIETSGSRLRHSSSNPRQGEWLAELVASVSRSARAPIQVVEIGTCVGISGLYILGSLAKSGGGKLITFEGSPELAAIARRNFEDLISQCSLTGVEFEIVIGPLGDTFSDRIAAIEGHVDLAFVDGNHLEEPTLQYHRSLREKMSDHGVIVHDDISWGPGMVRAWRAIVEMEHLSQIEELLLGGRPSRGIIRLGQSGGKVIQHHVDGHVTRTARRVRNVLARTR